MAPRLKILNNIIERLSRLNAPTSGRLYGVMYDNTLIVLTFSIDISNDSETATSHTTLQLNMPAEIDFCGVLVVGPCKVEVPHAFKDIDVTDNPLLLKCLLKGADLQAYFYIHQKLELCTWEVISEQDFLQYFAYVRLEASLPLTSEISNIVNVLEESRKNVASGKVGFYFPKSDMYLLDTDNDTKDISIGELLQTSTVCEGVGNNKNNVKSISEIVDVIPVDMFLKSTKDRLLEDVKYAPVLQYVKRSYECLQFNLKIDTLSLISHSMSTTQLYVVLVESICRNLKLIERSFEQQLINENISLKIPEPIHFKPRNCGHLFTIIYPAGCSDEKILEYRKSLHRILSLDMDRPYFREGNAVKFQNDLNTNKLLLNPHEALPPSKVTGGKLSIVEGLYSYHHYMQDEFDDNGWGCAYRSLQTIVSWYRFQGYTNKPIPTHRMIQKCLVDIGDKPSSFIGSKQWIGSTEVGFVLETMLGVTIKVLRASSGEEMTTLATSLAHHFQNQGTPVMIGGGVLAHTILGVDYNENSDEVKFLILDPHYTGPENLSTVVSKGWCGWKTKDFWKIDAFYNMCLPQRPICI